MTEDRVTRWACDRCGSSSYIHHGERSDCGCGVDPDYGVAYFYCERCDAHQFHGVAEDWG